MRSQFPIRAVAACFALACFGVAILSGLGADRDAAAILRSAILALLLGQFVGLIGGWAMARCFGEALAAHRRTSEAEEVAAPAAKIPEMSRG